MTRARVRARLGAVDRHLARPGDGPATLDPARSTATPLLRLVPESLDDDVHRALGDGMAEIVEAWIEHFPENIFWDVDLVARILSDLEEPRAIELRARRIAELARVFGRQTEIRFQYVHDFLYGYDWCRWVARDPEEREREGPFSRPFLEYLERRQAELLDLIANDDAKYPRLENGRPRNPFGFSRRHDDERQLLRALAAEGSIPVEAWHPHGRCTWNRPFARRREEVAGELGLTDATS